MYCTYIILVRVVFLTPRWHIVLAIWELITCLHWTFCFVINFAYLCAPDSEKIIFLNFLLINRLHLGWCMLCSRWKHSWSVEHAIATNLWFEFKQTTYIAVVGHYNASLCSVDGFYSHGIIVIVLKGGLIK